MEKVTVRVPATTANLGVGFDTLGCALRLYNTLSFTLSDKLSFSGCDAEYQTPDNLAPALFGGLTASMMADGQVYTVSYPVHPELRFVLLSPDFPLSTHAARSVLPQSIPFKDAVAQLSRLALLPKALELGDEALIAHCLQDRLHQPYRFPLIEESDALRSLAHDLGCDTFCISGAGPTLLCITRDGTLAERLSASAVGLKHHWHIQELAVDHSGASCL